MKKWLAIPILAIAGMLAGVTGAHAQTCNTAAFNIPVGKTGSTAVVTIPGDGSPNSGCTKIVIDVLSAALYDPTESCAEYFYIIQGTTVYQYNDVLATSTDTVDHQVDRLPTWPLTDFMWFTGHNGGLIEFGGHCANSTELINVTAHYAP